jgi:hypothetical protein
MPPPQRRPPTNNDNPLFIAAKNNNLRKVNELLEAGTNVNDATKGGTTPLMIACEKGHSEIVKRLLAVPGIDVNKSNRGGETALHVACDKNNAEIIRLLLAVRDIDVNVPNNGAITPFYNACYVGNIDIIQMLLAFPGIDVNNSARDDISPLMIACQEGHAEVIDKLLKYPGIDVNKSNDDKINALYIACQKGFLNIVKMLLAIPGIDDEKAIHAAKQNKFSEEIKKLLLAPGPLWQGWTRSDIDRLNEIFDETMAPNITLCPVCLKTITRDKGCMHMKHNCKGLPGFYHKRLYDLYNTNNEIHWCTICGRIGFWRPPGLYVPGYFAHYKLGLAELAKPPGKHEATHVMDDDCATRSGGGGLREKLMRFQRVREMAFNLNKPDYIGKIDEKKAKEMLTEAMWNAPLVENPDINEMMRTKSWNIPNTAFPHNVAKEESNAPNIPMPPTHLDPIVHPETTAAFQNAILISDKNIIQFRHEGNMHDQKGQQISREAFFSFLQSIGVNEAEEGFLKCWQFVPEAKRHEGDHHCGVKLYPQEVRIALGLAEVSAEGENAEYRKMYELYRKKFNMAAKTGGRRTRKRKQLKNFSQ